MRLAHLVSLHAIVVLAIGCGPRNKFIPPEPPKVMVSHPTLEKVVEYAEFTGTTRATASVQVQARINGYLKEINFTDGQTVRKGDSLFVIEPETFEVALKSAEAALDKTVANLKLAESQLIRSQQLARTNAVSPEEIDVAMAEKQARAADVESAKSAVAQAKLDLSYTKVVSPIDGRIGRHMVDVGNLVQAEATLLTTIESYVPIHAYFNISEGDYLRFSALRKAHVLPDPETQPITLYLGLPNEEGFPHEGRLDYRDLGVDPESGTLLRRGVFPNVDQELVPGLFVRLRAALGQPTEKVLVDDRAIATDQRGDYMLVVNADNVVEYRPVQLGQAHGLKRVIERGVTPDDQIIVNGIQRARPGTKVVPMTADSPEPTK